MHTELNEENAIKFRAIRKYLVYHDYISERNKELAQILSKYRKNTNDAAVGNLVRGDTKATRKDMLTAIEKVARNFGVDPKQIYQASNEVEATRKQLQKVLRQNKELEESNKRLVATIEQLENPNPEKIAKYYIALFELAKSNYNSENLEAMRDFVYTMQHRCENLEAAAEFERTKANLNKK